MGAITVSLGIILALAAVTPANAKGCLKGAVVGGVAGHYTVHHGLLGAAAGCIIGRHEAKKRAQVERAKKEHPISDNGEERL
jgi:outer membrane lipoprotein SlyB